jgi:hypothetical protein
MKNEIQKSVSRSSRLSVQPAPSMRVLVNADNRAYLRWLRAAELSAWEAGRVWSGKHTFSRPVSRGTASFKINHA